MSARCANRSELSHVIRRIDHGVIAENREKARGTGDLRVVLFPRASDELPKCSAGLRGTVKVMIGGAPVTEAFARRIGADGCSPNGAQAVNLARSLVGES